MREYPECVDIQDKIYVKERKSRRAKISVTCPDCKQTRYVDKREIDRRVRKNIFTGRCHKCNPPKGKENKNWKHGKCLKTGYIYDTIETNHPLISMAGKRNRIAEHRLIIAKHLNRPLLSNEVVHHIDGNRSNNKIENLVLLTKQNHFQFERALQLGKVKRKAITNYAVKK